MRYAWILAGLIAAGLGIGCPAAPASPQDTPSPPPPPPPPPPPAPTTVRPEAHAQTKPVPSGGDAADDPAVWIHPSDPALSLILGTDKGGGLHAYGMDGSELQVVSRGAEPNNVDVVYGFQLGGRRVDLAVASARGAPGPGVRVWAIDAGARTLSDVTADGVIPVFEGGEPYGACAYRSSRTGRLFVFVTDQQGRVEQHELRDAGDGTVGTTRVRSLAVGSTAEGCVADDALGFVYVAEEEVGIWKFAAEPDAGDGQQLVTRVGDNGLVAQVEGLAIYSASQGGGYLIASSQGNDTFIVYERSGANRYVLTIDPADGSIDDVSETDGIALTSCATSPQFARGIFLAQDGDNRGGNQNFKMYRWQDIAGTSLVTDTACRPRAGE